MSAPVIYEDQPRYYPHFRIIPFVDHFEKGHFYKRFALCLASPGQGHKPTCGVSIYWSLNDSRVVLFNTATGKTLLYATEGLDEYLSTTPVYNAVDNSLAGVFSASDPHVDIKNHISKQVVPRDFKCFYRARACHTIVHGYTDIVRIQYSHTVGPALNFLPFQNISENERNLLLIYAAKAFATISGKFMRMPLVPVGQLGLINSADSAIKPSTVESICYTLSTLANVRFVLSSYQSNERKSVNILKDNCRIVFTLEYCKIGTQDGGGEDCLIDVNDNFGVTFFKATGLKMNQRLTVNYSNQQLIGSAEQYIGDLYAQGTRQNTYILDDRNQRIMEVRYCPITETVDVSRFDQGCNCEIFSVSDPNIRIAKLWVDFNRLHMKLTPINTISPLWKLLVLLFGAKIVNRFFTKKYKNMICTPHLGYI